MKSGAEWAQKTFENSSETVRGVSSDLTLKTISALRANAEAVNKKVCTRCSMAMTFANSHIAIKRKMPFQVAFEPQIFADCNPSTH